MIMMMMMIIIISGSKVLVKTLVASHQRFRNPIDTWQDSFGRVISQSQRPLPTQEKHTKTNIHASSGIGNHDPSNQAVKTYALYHATTGTGL
jgi:hypothetical protein